MTTRILAILIARFMLTLVVTEFIKKTIVPKNIIVVKILYKL